MNIKDFFMAGLLALLPISEVRGAIPYAIGFASAPWYLAFLYCTAMNALAAPIAFAFLSTAHKLLYRWAFYKRLFDRFVERAREKVKDKVEKYGYLGLMIFVAIPAPLTGAWTGVLGAWILGMDRKKAMLAVVTGVAIAGALVTAIVTLGLSAFSFFVATP